MGINNYRSAFSSFLFLFLTSIFFSCSSDPEQTVEEYLELTYKKNNVRKAYRMLSKDDQKYKSERDFTLDFNRKNLLPEKLKKQFQNLVSYEIKNVEYLTDDTVKVVATVYKPSSKLTLKEVLIYAMASSANLNESDKNKFLESHYENLIKQSQDELEAEEKEFILIKENGDYKLFFDYGKPFRESILLEKLDLLSQDAKEKIRKMDFEGAKRIYKEMLELKEDDQIKEKIKELDEELCTALRLGDKKELGNIFIKPLKLEVKNVLIEKKNWMGSDTKKELSSDKYLVLTLLVSNQDEGEFFNLFEPGRYRQNHLVTDNYGNEMIEFKPDFDVLAVEDNIPGKILPGETRIVKAVCEAPLSPKADKFSWKMRLMIDNQKTVRETTIHFNRNDIQWPVDKEVKKGLN